MHVKSEEIILKGIPICRGVAIGKPFFLNSNDFKVFESLIDQSEVEREIERYWSALSCSKQDIKRLQKQLESESAAESILILDAQLEMLQDPLLTVEIEKAIRITNKNAEFIFQQALEQFREKFEALDDSFFTERFKDLRDVGERVLSYLYESGHPSLNNVPPQSVVCSIELSASAAAEAQTASIVAFVTESGGITSHAAIVAKAKGIPYITNISLDLIKENGEQMLVVDGRTGDVIINPHPKTIRIYEDLQQSMRLQSEHFEQAVHWSAETFDGYAIRLLANIEMIQEADLVHRLGGQGVGLFRSEYIFLPKNEIPSEEEQFVIYRQLAESMKSAPVAIRTFDLGGDKASFYPGLAVEHNPFLGSRVTRFLLKEKGLLKAQLRAILRASQYGNVSILFPMISTLSELREAKQMVYDVQEELKINKSIRIGCMIEVPSAALLVDHFAKECNFLSIGTNDLFQYSLAIDRSDQIFAEMVEPTDPSILRLIKLIITEANQHQIPVSVCGEIASDPRFTSLLLGLGVQELSVTPRYLPVIKNAVRHTSIVEAVRLADQALNLQTAQEIMELLVNEYKRSVPKDLLYNVGTPDQEKSQQEHLKELRSRARPSLENRENSANFV